MEVEGAFKDKTVSVASNEEEKFLPGNHYKEGAG
jgi:hypothetical protein